MQLSCNDILLHHALFILQTVYRFSRYTFFFQYNHSIVFSSSYLSISQNLQIKLLKRDIMCFECRLSYFKYLFYISTKRGLHNLFLIFNCICFFQIQSNLNYFSIDVWAKVCYFLPSKNITFMFYLCSLLCLFFVNIK